MAIRADADDAGVAVRLPSRIRSDKPMVRTALMRRLAANWRFAYGGRSGSLRAAANRSGRPFRLDVRQRVIVKALVSRHIGKTTERGAALARHLSYLMRPGAGAEKSAARAFDAHEDDLDARGRISNWAAHRHHFRFIVSPEHGDRIKDLKDYTREVMRRVCADLGEPDLPWLAVCHFDTDQPHAHILAPGRRSDGRDLVIPRSYMGFGFRARAQEVAQERLGDLSRADAERRIWREVRADRFTALDRRLIASADANLHVRNNLGDADAWSALRRGRLAHLESLGLAERCGQGYRLAGDLGLRLSRMQASRDIIRSLNQWAVESGRTAEPRAAGQIKGRIMKLGFTDELGAAPYAIVRQADGRDMLARFAPGVVGLKVGRQVDLAVDSRGLARLVPGRGPSLGR